MAVRNIDTIHFSSRTKENAERLAQEVANNYNVSTKVFEEADDAMEEADVVVTATNSNHPVYSHSLHPGVHLNAVGSFKPDMQELPSESMLVANKIVVESVEVDERNWRFKGTSRRRHYNERFITWRIRGYRSW